MDSVNSKKTVGKGMKTKHVNTRNSVTTKNVPKMCRNFVKIGQFRFNEDCAYTHEFQINTNHQNQINKVMTGIIRKHDTDQCPPRKNEAT